MLAIAALNTNAQFMSGNKLLERMNKGPFSEGVAMGYVLGIADENDNFMFCLPSNLSAGQANDIIKAKLDLSPEIRHKQASVIVNETFARYFPCKK